MFPDLQVVPLDVVSDGQSRVTVRWCARGTFAGALADGRVPPTRKPVCYGGLWLGTFNSTRQLVRGYAAWDTRSLLCQLGVLDSGAAVAGLAPLNRAADTEPATSDPQNDQRTVAHGASVRCAADANTTSNSTTPAASSGATAATVAWPKVSDNQAGDAAATAAVANVRNVKESAFSETFPTAVASSTGTETFAELLDAICAPQQRAGTLWMIFSGGNRPHDPFAVEAHGTDAPFDACRRLFADDRVLFAVFNLKIARRTRLVRIVWCGDSAPRSARLALSRWRSQLEQQLRLPAASFDAFDIDDLNKIEQKLI